MNEIRKFDKQDWECYAGAEEFSKNSEPLILDIELEANGEATVIAGKNGLEFYVGVGFDGEMWQKDLDLTALRAEGELRAIQRAVKEITNAADLAYELEHPTKEALKGFKSSGNW